MGVNDHSPDTTGAPRVRDVAGLPVDALTMNQSVELACSLIEGGGFHLHTSVNAAVAVEASENPDLAKAIKESSIVNADGMSFVWASRFLRTPLPERVPATDFMQRLIERAETNHWPVYLLGARAEVVERVAAELHRRHPGLVVAGFRDGYWKDGDEKLLVREVVEAGPRLLFIGVPSPRKELFAHQHSAELADVLAVGVGGAFDVIAGVTKRAPESWQRLGLEWAYRFKQEPRRLWRRYLIGNIRFVGLVLSARRRNRLR